MRRSETSIESHANWLINLATNLDRVRFETGNRKLHVGLRLIRGDEQRPIGESVADRLKYAVYGRLTDGEIAVVCLTPIS